MDGHRGGDFARGHAGSTAFPNKTEPRRATRLQGQADGSGSSDALDAGLGLRG